MKPKHARADTRLANILNDLVEGLIDVQSRLEFSQAMVAEHIEGYGDSQLGVQSNFWTRTRKYLMVSTMGGW